MRGENYSAFRGLNAYVQAIAETADRHHAGKPTHPWFGSARLDPARVVADLREHVLDTVLRPQADTRWIGFKEVRYEPGHFAELRRPAQLPAVPRQAVPGHRLPRERARSGGGGPQRLVAGQRERTRGARDHARWLAEAVVDLTRILGAGRAVLVDHDDWSAARDVLIEAFAALGLPRDDEAVRAVLGDHLDHGPHSSEPT